MTSQGIWYPHSIVLPDASAITQLTELSSPINLQQTVERASGMAAPQYAGGDESRPQIVGTGTHIKQIIDALGTEKIAADLSGGDVVAYWRKGNPFSTRIAKASSAHLRATMSENAMLCWSSISANQGSPASIQFMIIPAFDGTNAPVLFETGVAAAGVSTVTHLYAPGPIYINGTRYSHNGFTIDSGSAQVQDTADGEAYPSYAGIDTYAPTITFRTKNAAAMATFGVNGIALTSLSVYLRKKVKGGMRVSDVTAEHIKASATVGHVFARELRDSPGEVEIMVQPTMADEDTPPLAWNTAIAITS